MTYKSLSLAALLLPFFTYGVTKNEQINKLKEARLKKFTEIKALGDTIIGYDRHNMGDIDYCRQRITEEAHLESSSAEELKAKREKLVEELTFGTMFEESYRKSKPFEVLKNMKHREQFYELHFTVINFFLELHVELYDKLIQELLVINKQIFDLETK